MAKVIEPDKVTLFRVLLFEVSVLLEPFIVSVSVPLVYVPFVKLTFPLSVQVTVPVSGAVIIGVPELGLFMVKSPVRLSVGSLVAPSRVKFWVLLALTCRVLDSVCVPAPKITERAEPEELE